MPTGRALIVIPAFNERGVIGDLVRQLRATAADVLVVDDGSSDGTADEARAAGARVLTLVTNLGYGSALKAGYLVAIREGYEVVVQMDGDGQHDPSSIADLLAPILDGSADLVLGARDRSRYPMPFARKVGQRVFAGLLVGLSGLRVADPTTGFQAIGPRVLRLLASDEFPGDYPDTDVLLFLALHGCRIQEVPALFHVNARGTSMHAGILRPAYYVYKMTLSMFLVYSRYRHLRALPAPAEVRP